MLLAASFVCQIAGFYCLYNRSAKAVLPKDCVSAWLQNHALSALLLGITELVLSFWLLKLSIGLAAGVLTGAVALMTIGSLIVILFPLFTRGTDARKS
ncbi:hypothetical protein [Chryseosolibacter indicus]|uniref:Uncharacterized protein n=1 Tax=Chryseosolibacter indicus TaxID=2782351 RepID=A0ABS5VTU4_9BACT|nr:hypothetical protein [Chryseosolibacter indicus]MBT1704751.1 hypothetical protein [Chryseosolibacter indicus]